MEYAEIKQVIIDRRKREGLTMEGLGQKIGKSKQAIYQFENNDSANISTILEVCNAVGLTIEIKEK